MLNLKVAFFATTSNMDSGASWSLLRMIINLHKNGITPIVFLQKHGNIEEKLNAYISMSLKSSFMSMQPCMNWQ